MHGDNPRSVTKSKELEVHQALRDAQITFEYQHYLPFRGCGLESETAHAYADFALPMPWGYVLLEVDEEQRKAYDPSCDVRRDFDMAASVALGSGRKLLVLRYNPDAFKIAGVTRRTTKKERHAQLIRLLGELLAREPEAPFTRLFLFYDRAAENNALPCVAEHWSEPVRSDTSVMAATAEKNAVLERTQVSMTKAVAKGRQHMLEKAHECCRRGCQSSALRQGAKWAQDPSAMSRHFYTLAGCV